MHKKLSLGRAFSFLLAGRCCMWSNFVCIESVIKTVIIFGLETPSLDRIFSSFSFTARYFCMWLAFVCVDFSTYKDCDHLWQRLRNPNSVAISVSRQGGSSPACGSRVSSVLVLVVRFFPSFRSICAGNHFLQRSTLHVRAPAGVFTAFLALSEKSIDYFSCRKKSECEERLEEACAPCSPILRKKSFSSDGTSRKGRSEVTVTPHDH